MLRISQVKLRVGHTEAELEQKLCRLLHTRAEEIKRIVIRKQSLDARHKPELFYVYTVDVEVAKEREILERLQKKRGNNNISLCTEQSYRFPEAGSREMKNRPVIVGCGPAGLFCACFLAAYGYRPILIEQGAPVEERQRDIQEFWETGVLRPDSNVQFGEGGAGTFSDGKLNTLVKDPAGRIRKVLEIFADHGAPSEILYQNKPHIGTDVLRTVIRAVREDILKWGGEICFHTKMTDILTDPASGKVEGILVKKRLENGAWSEQTQRLDTNTLILAPGHSARDTFRMLFEHQIPMEAKSFAVGVRVEHPQELINRSQYGQNYPEQLPAAAYKLTAKLPDGRGVYSFCMCPGGHVVNASSEEGHLAVNGMSYHARDSRNANSAIVVTVSPEDYGGTHPLAGIEFQRRLERTAWKAGNGKIPAQRYGEFYEQTTGEPLKHTYSPEIEELFQNHQSCMKGESAHAGLGSVLPEFLCESLVLGMEEFDRKIRGFSHPQTVLSAVESRTSSPVRILRNQELEGENAGLYPCGEGAGYAGGITSAAVDGIKIAEAIRRKYAPFDKNADGLRKI